MEVSPRLLFIGDIGCLKSDAAFLFFGSLAVIPAWVQGGEFMVFPGNLFVAFIDVKCAFTMPRGGGLVGTGRAWMLLANSPVSQGFFNASWFF